MAKKIENIFKRGEIFWIRYTVDGEQRRESVGRSEFTGKSERTDAVKLLKIREAQILTDKLPPEIKQTRTYTFDDLCDKYDIAVKSQKGYEKDKKYKIRAIKARFGSLPVSKMTHQVIEAWQKELAEKEVTKGVKKRGTDKLVKVQGGTVNRSVACLKHMMTFAVKNNMYTAERLLEIRIKTEMAQENDYRERYLTKEECAKLLNACDKRILPMVVIGLHTGLRRGSVLGMTWDKVDFVSGIITIPIVNSKTSKTLHVRMSATVRTILEALPRYGEYCFCWKNGKPYSDFRESFIKALEKAGIEDFHLHDLRHTFASLNVMAGEDIYKVSKYLGHSTVAMTQRYAHLHPDFMKSAANNMDEIAPVPVAVPDIVSASPVA